MAAIQPLTFPIIGDAVTLNVTILNFSTSAPTCDTRYELITADGRKCADGYYTLTAEEFDGWGQDNSYIDELVASKIGVQIVPTP